MMAMKRSSELNKTMLFKDDFYSFFIFDRSFLHLHNLYCRKVNAEFNKLIKTVGHHTRFFEK